MDDFDDVESSLDDVASDGEGGEAGSNVDAESDAVDVEESDFVGDDAAAGFGRLPRSAQNVELSAADQIAKWHDTLLPVEADLISELDGTNLFFINAESMIIDLLLSKEVNFQEDTQFLRMIFSIEHVLHSITSCGGSFRLVFFDGFKKLFSSAFGEAVLALRQALLCHCRAGKGIDHKVFPHWYSPEWKEHVAVWRPSFFLVANDAIELEDEDEEEDEEEDEGAKEKAKKEKANLRELFRALMLSCLGMKTHVALLRGMQRRGNRMFSFTMESDNYESWVDHNVQAAFLPMLTGEGDDEEEEEENEEDEDITPALKEFQGAADGKIEDNAMLRSFLAVKFSRETLEACEGQNAATVQLMKLVVKTLLLQEMMLRQIPLDKRAYTIPAEEDWSFFAEKISSAALDRYFTTIGQALGKLQKEEAEEGLVLDACDLFDGRLYRHLFHAVVAQGMSNKGKIESGYFKFQSWVQKELDFLWDQVNSGKDSFFPVDMKSILEFQDLEPPAMPPQAKVRPKASLKKHDNEFLKTLWKDVTFETIDEQAAGEAPDPGPLADKHKWTLDKTIDSLKAEETMEENEGEKRLKAKMAAKKKITAWDLEFQKKFLLKRRQMALRALAGYAKSLTGSDKMHPPIIMKEESKKDEKAEPEKQKLSAKHQELLEKRKVEEENKIKAHDAEQMKNWDKTVDTLGEVQDVEKFEKDLLDLMLGFARITDSFVGFPAVTSAFKTSEAQAKIIVKVVKSCRSAFKKMQLDKLPAASQPQARRVVRYFFCILQEAFNSYGKKDLDGKSIKLFQECLIAIGFPSNAKTMFARWKDAQIEAAAKAAAETAAPAEKDKGGKAKAETKKGAKADQKKDAKDDKKDKKDKKEEKGKKDDKKSSKTDKAEEENATEATDLGTYEVTKTVEPLWSGVGSDEMAFQLMYLGPYMTRSVGNAKDPLNRVMFKPDSWQKDLLDIVDDQKSALIVAPTASGKTFIGYYVMDKVLRADNEGVAVYVAPSKALVNQVSAEIYARFSSKTYPAHSKNELLGVFLREFNSAGGYMEQGRWKNCQVLVTIPHILEMLLLSPNNQDWVKRLRYIVFDEVHCIGEQEGGAQWEHTMQTIPCPFLALSATVADPSFFHGWLGQVSKKKGLAQVDFVQHTERWNDLYKYVFENGKLRPLHPFCCLLEQSLKKNGLASDLSLTPAEMVQLYLEVRKVLGKSKAWGRLAPAVYFAEKNVGFIKKKDAREYEKELKETFLQILHDGTLTTEGFEQVALGLQQPTLLDGEKDYEKLQFTPPPRKEGEDTQTPEEPTDFRAMNKRSAYLQGPHLFRLCKELDKNQHLPAIVFNFSRKEIDSMLKRMLKEMKDQQYNKYYGDEDATYRSRKIMAKRMADYEAAKTAYEQAMKAKAAKNQASQAARAQKEDGARNVTNEATDVDPNEMLLPEPTPPVDIADEIDLEFSFHSPKAWGQWQEDIADLLKDLKRRGISQVLLDGLQRGIGMHHEACKTQYRQAVEILFRRGYLRVVFATGTLALGINMPCRSTIFCGDSLELNGLMFRQMSGRAGRRGFDLLGQVVFMDMSFHKVRRLIASDLSSLTGEFMLSPTTLLRVLQAWELTNMRVEEDRPLARSKEELATGYAPMFSLPFFRSSGADLNKQVAYHTRFSVELLRKEGLVDEHGCPRGLASFVAHLFETEPANFILSRLLTSGVLHDYLKAEEPKVKKGERVTHLTVKLTEILGWFLYRRRLPPSYAKSKDRKKHLPSKGCPALPPLPEAILKEVKKYNQGVFDLFEDLAFSVASTRKFEQCDYLLPQSERQFNKSWETRGAPFGKESPFQTSYVSQLVRFRARAPLCAISGAGDRFRSPNELVNTLRNIIQMDMTALPMVPPAPGCSVSSDELEATNSWALDFMIHGKISYLWEDNALDSSKAYKLISSLKETCKMATDAMKVYAPKDDIVLETFTQLAKDLDERLGGERGK